MNIKTNKNSHLVYGFETKIINKCNGRSGSFNIKIYHSRYIYDIEVSIDDDEITIISVNKVLAESNRNNLFHISAIVGDCNVIKRYIENGGRILIQKMLKEIFHCILVLKIVLTM